MVFLSICTALYDYEPQADNELAIAEGEIIYILEKSEDDGWWKAKKKAAAEDEEEPSGLIPNNYVEDASPKHQAKALYDYSRQTDEELSFSEDALLAVYDTSDPDWSLVGSDGEYGFAPANYIEITSGAEPTGLTPQASANQALEDSHTGRKTRSASDTGSGPASAMAGIMQQKSIPAASEPQSPSPPQRPQQFPPEQSDEESPAPSLPHRPVSQHYSPADQHASPRSSHSPGISASSPHNRAFSHAQHDEQIRPGAGGYHLYNISEMVSAMGKSKKMPTTLGINLATGQIMIAPERSRDGPQQEWTAEKLTHYSIEGKHVFLELVRPSKSVDFHAGAKDTAREIVAALGEIAGTARAGGLREVLEAAGSGSAHKKGQVLYDFMAQGEDEVTVAVGDEVVVLDDSKSDDWWMVRRLKTGKEGVVPSSYVEITGTVAPGPSKSAISAGKTTVELNRLEEERLAKEAVRSANNTSSEVGPGINLPARGSSLTSDGNKPSQRSKKEKSHGKGTSGSKSKPDGNKTRTWTDRSGAFKVEAQFIGLKDGKIHLHKLNGVKIAVPVVKMAIEDLEYVEQATGVSLDDDKPLSEVKRKGTMSAKNGDRKKDQSTAKAGLSLQEKTKQSDGSEYDWFDFFLKAGVSPYQCERYAFNFNKDSMDENILSDITPQVLRTLGLKEGDILRVMKYLDNKFNRSATSSDGANGGLFSGAGGAIRNNTSKGRPAPPVQTNNSVDGNAFKQQSDNEKRSKERQDSISAPGPPTPAKDIKGFDDDAWSVKPSKQSVPQAQQPSVASPVTPATPQQSGLTGSLLDLSLLSTPLQPTKVELQPQLPDFSQPTQTQQATQVKPLQQQPTGAAPSFFNQLGQPQQQHSQQSLTQNSNLQAQSQQTGPPRQRPQAPQYLASQQGSLVPPPPARPMSAPQNQQQNNFGPPPLQPQLTGYQPQMQYQNHNQTQNQIAPPGQSLNDLSQYRSQQQQHFNQAQLANQQQQQTQAQQTGFNPQSHNFNQFANGLQPQQTGFGQHQYQQSQGPAMQNPYVIGQQTGSPFADPRGPKPFFQQIQPQQTGYQPLPQQNTGYQPQYQTPLQPQQTGLNNILPQALQPQNTGVNGYANSGFGQVQSSMTPISQQQPTAAPLVPQQTGPAPPVRFGTQPANKLVAQPTGRKANLSAATPSNPFGF